MRRTDTSLFPKRLLGEKVEEEEEEEEAPQWGPRYEDLYVDVHAENIFAGRPEEIREAVKALTAPAVVEAIQARRVNGKGGYQQRREQRQRTFRRPQEILERMSKVRGWDDVGQHDPFRYVMREDVDEFRRCVEVVFVYTTLQPRALRAGLERVRCSLREMEVTMKSVGCTLILDEKKKVKGVNVRRLHYSVPTEDVDKEGKAVDSVYNVVVVGENVGEDEIAFKSFYFAK
jgi:hypothetical protein